MGCPTGFRQIHRCSASRSRCSGGVIVDDNDSLIILYYVSTHMWPSMQKGTMCPNYWFSVAGQISLRLMFCQFWDFCIFVKNHLLPIFLCKMGVPCVFNHPREAFTFSHSSPSCIAYNWVSIMRRLVIMATETAALVEFVQILNCAGQHWLCISTIGCKPKLIKVYENRRINDLPASTRESNAAILNSRTRNIYLIDPVVDGLFALAFAQTLCEGNDSSTITYSQDSLCSHFRSCINEKNITPFESHRTLYKYLGKYLKSQYQEYWFCRLANTSDDMVLCSSCKEWFYYMSWNRFWWKTSW